MDLENSLYQKIIVTISTWEVKIIHVKHEMKKSNQEKHLRDIVHESGKTKPNIEARKAKGYGLEANILAIVN